LCFDAVFFCRAVIAIVPPISSSIPNSPFSLHFSFHLVHDHHSTSQLSKDDQLETFLIRLSRKSGLDGLCGMQPTRYFIPEDTPLPISHYKLSLHRPLLQFSKNELIDVCQTASQPWVEDPSNRNLVYQRNAVRVTLQNQSQEVRGHFQQIMQDFAITRVALDSRFRSSLLGTLKMDAVTGSLQLPLDVLSTLSAPLRMRFWRQALWMVSGQPYPPRTEQIESLLLDLVGSDNHKSLSSTTAAPCDYSSNSDPTPAQPLVGKASKICVAGCVVERRANHTLVLSAQPIIARLLVRLPIEVNKAVWWNGRYVVKLGIRDRRSGEVDDDFPNIVEQQYQQCSSPTSTAPATILPAAPESPTSSLHNTLPSTPNSSFFVVPLTQRHVHQVRQAFFTKRTLGFTASMYGVTPVVVDEFDNVVSVPSLSINIHPHLWASVDLFSRYCLDHVLLV
jgi:hypothetical protein